MWLIVRAKLATKSELDEYYTLDDALVLFAMMQMENDIQAIQADELKKKSRR